MSSSSTRGRVSACLPNATQTASSAWGKTGGKRGGKRGHDADSPSLSCSGPPASPLGLRPQTMAPRMGNRYHVPYFPCICENGDMISIHPILAAPDLRLRLSVCVPKRWHHARGIGIMSPISPCEQQAAELLEAALYSQVASDYSNIAVGRNDPCPCGSGKKYKRCHG